MLISIASTQRIHFTNLQNTQGLFTLNLGTSRIIKEYINYIHIVNLSNLEDNINQIDSNVKEFKTHSLKYQSFNTLEKQIDQIRDKFLTLKPIYRTKRGLINGLGTLKKLYQETWMI